MGVIFLIAASHPRMAAIVMHAESRQAILLNVGAGIVGALVTGLVLNPLLGGQSLLGQRYEVLALLIALMGSILFLGALNVTRLARGQ